jgi:hypothetical protein
MDVRCKFVLVGDLAEVSIFETIKERVEQELAWDIAGLDHMEFEPRECSSVPDGLIRVPLVFKFHTSSQEEATILFDIYTWACGMARRYGRNFGIDEIAVDGWQVDVPEAYHVPQLVVEI